ncbi:MULTISPECIES: hypothetical protein [unclassified Arthrobacter]|uniref:hypothetical protein n=1 Tax=unclassified Arthrobacter TaxID=235627 RepID=UPI002E0650E1|nr:MULTISPECIES: hypothetical protein [unclassified Arthrobacter]MEC5193356.1 hypothetical protein [Arthrobacter sp. MP_M4]MEC5204822.1 hypothetical protein [Arthrobacter sp. MP_M7]
MATVDDSTHTVFLISQRPGMAYADVNGTGARVQLDSGASSTSGDYVLPVAMPPDGTALFPTDQPGTYAVGVPRETSNTG